MNSENARISVIVPIYNVEQYLEECIDSIIDQTYYNLQIILVNDGSTDCSGVICDRYKEKDKRIEVIHKANGGLSDARNVGLDHVAGEYVCFVDSDDKIDRTFVEYLYSELIRNKTQISACGSVAANSFTSSSAKRVFGKTDKAIRIRDKQTSIFFIFIIPP